MKFNTSNNNQQLKPPKLTYCRFNLIILCIDYILIVLIYASSVICLWQPTLQHTIPTLPQKKSADVCCLEIVTTLILWRTWNKLRNHYQSYLNIIIKIGNMSQRLKRWSFSARTLREPTQSSSFQAWAFNLKKKRKK